jgi:hypothetical protein
MADEKSQLETLTEQMKGWQAGSSGVDLQISAAGRDAYVQAIDALRGDLVSAQANLVGLNSMGSAGNYDSATDTKAGLEQDATTLDETLTAYIAYLDAYKQTIIDAANRMIQSG